jgi:Bacterial regulatory proteins, tetR family
MGIDEKERERAILDVTAELLLRHGYSKVTMSDVADAMRCRARLRSTVMPPPPWEAPSVAQDS